MLSGNKSIASYAKDLADTCGKSDSTVISAANRIENIETKLDKIDRALDAIEKLALYKFEDIYDYQDEIKGMIRECRRQIKT